MLDPGAWPRGFGPLRREASELTDTGGDIYHAFYSGFNYHIYGDKLKLMTGVEYSITSDDATDGGAFDGWTGFAGIRLWREVPAAPAPAGSRESAGAFG